MLKADTSTALKKGLPSKHITENNCELGKKPEMSNHPGG